LARCRKNEVWRHGYSHSGGFHSNNDHNTTAGGLDRLFAYHKHHPFAGNAVYFNVYKSAAAVFNIPVPSAAYYPFAAFAQHIDHQVDT
jgi:hypothetical protein